MAPATLTRPAWFSDATWELYLNDHMFHQQFLTKHQRHCQATTPLPSSDIATAPSSSIPSKDSPFVWTPVPPPTYTTYGGPDPRPTYNRPPFSFSVPRSTACLLPSIQPYASPIYDFDQSKPCDPAFWRLRDDRHRYPTRLSQPAPISAWSVTAVASELPVPIDAQCPPAPRMAHTARFA